MKLKVIFIKIFDIPRFLCILFLKIYRKICSPLYGDVCKYFPSCSAYALEAFTLYGCIEGSWLTFKRILRCNPFSKGGVDHVPQKEGCCLNFTEKPEIIILNHPVINNEE